MKKIKLIAVMVVVFVFGLLLGQDYEQYKLEKLHERERNARIDVVVAQRDLKMGEVIDETSAAFRGIPGKYKASYSVLPRDFKDVLDGKVLNRDIKSGEPILKVFVDSTQNASMEEEVSANGIIVAQGYPINIQEKDIIEKTENKDKKWHHDFFQRHITKLARLTSDKVLFMSDDLNTDLVIRENDKIYKSIGDHGSKEYKLVQIGENSITVHYRSEFSHHSFGDNKTTIDEGTFEVNYQE